jgi:hypothetical protein
VDAFGVVRPELLDKVALRSGVRGNQVAAEGRFPALLEERLLHAFDEACLMILLGTGMRVAELRALVLEDVEEDDDASFLKVRRGRERSSRGFPSAVTYSVSSPCRVQISRHGSVRGLSGSSVTMPGALDHCLHLRIHSGSHLQSR